MDVVFTKGFFAVYYDGKEFASSRNSVITGAPLNILLNSSVTRTPTRSRAARRRQAEELRQSPAAMAIKYLKVWSYQ